MRLVKFNVNETEMANLFVSRGELEVLKQKKRKKSVQMAQLNENTTTPSFALQDLHLQATFKRNEAS